MTRSLAPLSLPARRRLLVGSLVCLGLLAACAGPTPVEPGPDRPAATATPADPPSPAATAIMLTATPPPDDATPAPTAIPDDGPDLAVIELAPPVTHAPATMVAFEQDGQLFLQSLADGALPMRLDECPGEGCRLGYPKWSPDGQWLLYMRQGSSEAVNAVGAEIRLADREGQVQTLVGDAAFNRPAAWSPDGRYIAYLQPTDQFTEPVDAPPSVIYQLWAIPFAVADQPPVRQLAGRLDVADAGCGGGGRSLSDELYDREGGTSYGYHQSRLEWTVQNILLYSLYCVQAGVGRFDLDDHVQLEPYPQLLYSLALNPARDRWYAIMEGGDGAGPHALVTGTPDSLEATAIATSFSPELLFIGQDTGRLYLTARELIDGRPHDDQLGLAFTTYEAEIWVLNPDGSGETRLWQAHDTGFARLAELPGGELIFVRIENDDALRDMVLEHGLPPEQWADYYPRRHIVRLLPDAGPADQWIERAGLAAVN